jgi:hypothetical protein
MACVRAGVLVYAAVSIAGCGKAEAPAIVAVTSPEEVLNKPDRCHSPPNLLTSKARAMPYENCAQVASNPTTAGGHHADSPAMRSTIVEITRLALPQC